MSTKRILSAAATALILAGCAPKIQKPTEICPGKQSVDEALTALQANSQNITPFRADGQCYLEYYPEGKSKPKSESFVLQQLWVEPPVNFYFQGDKPPISPAMILGSNEQEFWMTIRPEISLYCWGLWSEQEATEGPMINPRTLLEALGIGEIDVDQDWSLSNKGPYDILTKRERGVIAKKMYIFSCDYQVRKIEFFNADGQVATVVELDRYKDVSEGFLAPAVIKVTTYSQSEREKPSTLTLRLERIRSAKITEPQRNFLFKRRPVKGLKNRFRIVNGKWIDESE